MAGLISEATIGQSTEFLARLGRKGFDIELLKKSLGDDELVERMIAAAREVPDDQKRHVISRFASPFTPTGWCVRKYGQVLQFHKDLVWNQGRFTSGYLSSDPTEFPEHAELPVEVCLYTFPAQEQTGEMTGEELKEWLNRDTPYEYTHLPATVLDYLLEHQALIPADWDGYVAFWGSLYYEEDQVWVYCMAKHGGQWHRQPVRVTGHSVEDMPVAAVVTK